MIPVIFALNEALRADKVESYFTYNASVVPDTTDSEGSFNN